MDTELLTGKFSEEGFIAITDKLLQRPIIKEASEMIAPASSKRITQVKNLGRCDDFGPTDFDS